MGFGDAPNILEPFYPLYSQSTIRRILLPKNVVPNSASSSLEIPVEESWMFALQTLHKITNR